MYIQAYNQSIQIIIAVRLPYVALDAEGKPLNKSYAFDENPANFVEFLKETLNNYKK